MNPDTDANKEFKFVKKVGLRYNLFEISIYLAFKILSKINENLFVAPGKFVGFV